jgi:hypothetical protein
MDDRCARQREQPRVSRRTAGPLTSIAAGVTRDRRRHPRKQMHVSCDAAAGVEVTATPEQDNGRPAPHGGSSRRRDGRRCLRTRDGPPCSLQRVSGTTAAGVQYDGPGRKLNTRSDEARATMLQRRQASTSIPRRGCVRTGALDASAGRGSARGRGGTKGQKIGNYEDGSELGHFLAAWRLGGLAALTLPAVASPTELCRCLPSPQPS